MALNKPGQNESLKTNQFEKEFKANLELLKNFNNNKGLLKIKDNPELQKPQEPIDNTVNHKNQILNILGEKTKKKSQETTKDNFINFDKLPEITSNDTLPKRNLLFTEINNKPSKSVKSINKGHQNADTKEGLGSIIRNFKTLDPNPEILTEYKQQILNIFNNGSFNSILKNEDFIYDINLA